MSKRANQISVPLDDLLRALIEREATREDRSLAGQIRHLVAEAARAAQVEERVARERVQ